MSQKKKDQPFNNPFGGIKLKQAEAPKAAAPAPPPREKPRKENLSEDARLFLESVGAVEPVKVSPTRVGPPPPRSVNEVRMPTEEAESLASLADLVSGNGEFDLADSDAFIEEIRVLATAGHGAKIRAELVALAAAHPAHGWDATEKRLVDAGVFETASA